MSDSTGIGVAKIAAAFAEQMRAYASPADQAIQRGIDECMRGVIRAQASMDPNLLKCPTALGPGTGTRLERKPEFGDLSRALLITPAGRGWQEPKEIGPVVKSGSMEERVLDRMIDNALGPALPKAAPKAGDAEV